MSQGSIRRKNTATAIAVGRRGPVPDLPAVEGSSPCGGLRPTAPRFANEECRVEAHPRVLSSRRVWVALGCWTGQPPFSTMGQALLRRQHSASSVTAIQRGDRADGFGCAFLFAESDGPRGRVASVCRTQDAEVVDRESGRKQSPAGGKEFMSWDSRGWQTNRSLFRKAQEACKWGVEHDLAEGHSRVFVPRRGWVGWGSCLRQSQKGHETPPLRAPK